MHKLANTLIEQISLEKKFKNAEKKSNLLIIENKCLSRRFQLTKY